MKLNQTSSLLLLALTITLAPFSRASADPAQALAKYQDAGTQLVSKLKIIRRDAGSCGMIGGQLAGKMDGSLQTQAGRDRHVADALNKAQAGDKAQAQGIIQAVIDEVSKGNADLKSNYSMVEYGLSTNTPTCQSAKAAFEAMATLSESLPKLLSRIASSL